MGTLQVGEFPEIMNYNLVDYIAIKLLFKKKNSRKTGPYLCVYSTPWFYLGTTTQMGMGSPARMMPGYSIHEARHPPPHFLVFFLSSLCSASASVSCYPDSFYLPSPLAFSLH